MVNVRFFDCVGVFDRDEFGADAESLAKRCCRLINLHLGELPGEPCVAEETAGTVDGWAVWSPREHSDEAKAALYGYRWGLRDMAE